MLFPEYLAARNESQRAFSMASGIPYRTVNRASQGEIVGGRSAVRISAWTRSHPTSDGAYVTVEELLSVPLEAA